MKAADMKVVGTMEEYRATKGISIRRLAEALAVDDSSLSKQLKEKRGSITLGTAYRIAEMLDGRVVFITDSDWTRWQDTDALTTRIAELESAVSAIASERDNLQRMLDTQAKVTAQQAEIIQHLNHRVEVYDERIDRRDQMLKQKDDIIAKLIDR